MQDAHDGAFAVSLAKDTGGQPSPVDAANWFIQHGGIWSEPQDGWVESDRDEQGVIVASGPSYLHTIQGSDQTWFVDSGYRCDRE